MLDCRKTMLHFFKLTVLILTPTFLFLASKSSAKIKINVKSIEPHKTTAPTFKPHENNKIWLNSKDGHSSKAENYKPSDNFNVVKNSPNEIDQPKLSKGKWNSNKQNTIGNEQDKPSKSDKWNFYERENESFDDDFYWDSINNYAEKNKKDNSKKSLKVSQPIEMHFINYKSSYS